MTKKVSLIVTLALLISVYAGCEKQQRTYTNDQPVSNLPNITHSVPINVIGDTEVEVSKISEAKIGDVVIFGNQMASNTDLLWWVVSEDEDSLTLLCSYITDRSDYIYRRINENYEFEHGQKIFNTFSDDEYLRKYFSQDEIDRLLPTGDTIDGKDLLMTVPKVNDMLEWFPDLLETDKKVYRKFDMGGDYVMSTYKSKSNDTDIRLNPPVVDSITESVNLWWLGDFSVKSDYNPDTESRERNFLAIATHNTNNDCYVYYAYITEFIENYYGGIRPVIKIKK
ncbi:MAG: hypothetical protein GX321_01775 [Clostridiales bacterium]|nr:hypothetical protein [Clostridiales bacterium]